MKFLFPGFLFALSAIAIPIIIHLFSFKYYKTVYFSNVSFLKDIKKESKNKTRLKQILILIARILTIIFLVFAFSQPYIPVKNEIKQHAQLTVGIYIDNSFSMNALSDKGQLLETARNKALEICLAYPAGTRFKLLTNDLLLKHQHVFNREQFVQQVSDIKSSPAVIPLSMIFNRFAAGNAAGETGSDKLLYFISDFQRPVTDLENFKNEQVSAYFIPLKPAEINNLYIDSCWFEIPAHHLKQEEEIFVKIKNSSNQDYQNLPLKMILNDSIKSITNFSVNRQNEIVTSLKYSNTKSGLQLGRIEISDYPFTHDNNWYISYQVKPKLRVLAISGNSADSKEGTGFLSALFGNDEFVMYDEVNSQNIQISKLNDYDAIFMVNPDNISNGFLSELRNAVASGVSVVLFPGNNMIIANQLLEQFGVTKITGIDTTRQKISGIELDNRFYANVFRKKEENPVYPETRGHYRFESNSSSAETKLLWYQNSDKALSVNPYENGKVWVFSIPLNRKNESFARDVIFVPTIYNIVLNSVPAQQNSLLVGNDNFFNLKGSQILNLNSAIELVNPAKNEKYIPAKHVSGQGTVIELTGIINSDGHYLVQNEDTTIAAVSFNYDRRESDLRYYSASELEDKIGASKLKSALVIENAERNFSEIFDEIENGRPLWKWFIALAIIMLLTEIAIIRFWK